MAWQDRPYYRDRPSGTNPLMWILSGSVPLFTAFGIRVRAHASLLLYAVLILLLGLGQGFAWQDRVQNVSILFAIVLLHEFGHCFAARWVGGSADDILMHPLGGFAYAMPPRRPLPTFITVAAGPAVNLVICLICGSILWFISGWLPWNPFYFTPPHRGAFNWLDLWRYTYWIYEISLMLLIFNLLPIYPLDGGQILQTMLWPKFGYYKSTIYSCVVGMVGAILGAMIALATLNIFLGFLALMGFLYCMNYRRQLIAMGPEEYADSTDYSAAYEQSTHSDHVRRRRRRFNPRVARKLRKLAQQAEREQRQIDEILAKVSAHGMNSLTWFERRALHKATEKQRKRDEDMELLRGR